MFVATAPIAARVRSPTPIDLAGIEVVVNLNIRLSRR
jgi:hypothetical protein